ncbi:MAG: PKD domain-containing protein [Candidatus Marithrix sp.]
MTVGTSYGWNNHSTWWRNVCPERWNVYAGDGGGIEIKAGIIKNYSNIIAGDGGNAGIVYHGLARAGDGGYVLVSSDNVNDSVNTGTIITGNGGWSRGYRNGIRYATGGNVIVNLGDFNGEIVGAPGSSLWGDPINLNFGAELKIRDFESVNLYTDEGGTMNFTKVNENTFSNIKVISIATKSLNGEGGSLDLRGLSGKIFKATEKVEIFADTILLDDGVDINDLIEAPEIVIGQGKLIYHVQLNADQYVVGEPNSTITIPVRVFNASPKSDSYTFTVIDSADWVLGTIAEVTVESLKSAEVNLNITLPSERATNNEITIIATSKAKSNVTSETKIHAMVHAGEDSDGDEVPDVLDAFPDNSTEWLDTDNDGVGNNTDTDDDGDGMPDTWENKYERLSSVVKDDADDLDEDGFSNFAEYEANTDPTDPNSKPVVEPDNISPTAALTITPNTGEAPLTVTLDGSNSTDTDGTIASYKWTASDGQTAEGQNAELIFNEAETILSVLK